MARKGENLHKENDSLTAAGNKAIYKAEKAANLIKEEMKKPEMVKAVMDFIFSGDPEAVSPLDEIRKGK